MKTTKARKRKGAAAVACTELLACPACNGPGTRVKLNFLCGIKMGTEYEAGCVNMACELYGRTFPLCVWNRQANDRGQAQPPTATMPDRKDV
jgi:hypothetical protein